MSLHRGDTLLCVVHYPANTGFAWNYIEGLYADVADAFAADGVRTFVAYPEIAEPPRTLAGSAAEPLLLDASLGNVASITATIRAIRRLRVRTVYFTDRGWWHWSFPLLRAAGVRRIVAHDHTSGARTPPRGIRRAVKRLRARLPLVSADLVITVSHYVARRHRDVNLANPDQVITLWNGIELPSDEWARAPAPIPEMADGRPVVLCVCRAAAEKGVNHLLVAFDRMRAAWPVDEPPPRLVYVGNGPVFDDLVALRDSLATRDDIVFTGYRSDVPRFVAHCTVAAVPSVWQDACPLGVLEPMSHAKPVVASAVGGVPEQLDDGRVGVLVPAGDEDALAGALAALLRDRSRRRLLGDAGRDRVGRYFNRAVQMATLVRLVRGEDPTPRTNA